MTEDSFWQKIFLGNSLEQILFACIAFVFFILLIKLIQSLILSRLEKIAEKSDTKPGKVFIHIVESIKPPFYYFVALYLAISFLTMNMMVRKVVNAVLVIWLVYQVVLCMQVFVDYLVRRSMGAEREKDAKSAIGLIKIVVSIVLWIFGALFVFSNLGVNITSLVAGLGIGGVAVALAIQNILRDLFSSFAIFFDKPFSVGDYISLGDYEGVVKQIGIKTTRLQALSGEEVVISNQELTSAKLKNFSKLKERRINFKFRIASDTDSKTITKLSDKIAEIFNSIEITRFEKAIVTDFNKDGVEIDVIYHILSNQFDMHLEVQEEILLALRDVLNKEKIKLS